MSPCEVDPTLPSCVAMGNSGSLVVVYNPIARNPIVAGIMGADIEYVAEDRGDHYELYPLGD